MGNLDLKTIWSPQASWNNVFVFFSRKCLNKDIKKGIAEPFFQIFCFKIPFLRTFHKISDKVPPVTPKPCEQLQNPGSGHPSLIGARSGKEKSISIESMSIGLPTTNATSATT